MPVILVCSFSGGVMNMSYESVELLCVAYQAGIDAYMDGKSEDDNPWTTIALQGHAWERGYIYAEERIENAD